MSDNGEYVFRIVPTLGSDKPYQPGTCRGILYAKKGDELSLKWERQLINDVCPIDVRVANSGKYVITVGEWYEFEKLPIVVYGGKGSLINVYGELKQIADTRHFMPDLRGRTGGTTISLSVSGWHWLSRCVMFFEENDDWFVVRLRNKEVLVFETSTGQLTDDRWKEVIGLLPGGSDKYDDFKADLGRLIVLKALKLAGSDVQKERGDGLFVLEQCRDRHSISALEHALEDSTSTIVNTPQGRLRKYPIRKAAKEALEAAGEKVPGNVVIEEKVEGGEENQGAGTAPVKAGKE